MRSPTGNWGLSHSLQLDQPGEMFNLPESPFPKLGMPRVVRFTESVWNRACSHFMGLLSTYNVSGAVLGTGMQNNVPVLMGLTFWWEET